ncbi:MAG TPA: glutathione S-transferase family protein [Myxococcota bacterium]|nr:glutathione S-transferase family protein [Myxococcota bacterium]
MAELYHVPTSRSLRVLWALEEMGAIATVDVKSLGTRPRLQEPEYLAVNPAGTLPAMIDGDRALYESLAICDYLAARHGSNLIVAPGEPERPEFMQWLLYGEATLQAPLSVRARVGRIRNKTPEMQAGIDAVLADARHSLSMRLKLLEQRLEGRDFLVAERMTLADISVGYPIYNIGRGDFAPMLGPRAAAYRERLVARPAFQRALAVP